MNRFDLVGFGQGWPVNSPGSFALSAAGTLLTAGVLTPVTLSELATTYHWPSFVAPAGAVGLIGLAGPVYAGKFLELARRRRPAGKKHGFMIAGMPVGYDDMRTSILVTGVTGSSKTAGVLMPALAQLFVTYNEETDDELSKNPFQKLGAFIPEVKGDLVDGCIYLAHEAGRCVSRDVMIISPNCRIPVVRYRDDSSRFWYLSGRGAAGGSDAGAMLPRLHFPSGHHRAGRLVPSNVFEFPADLAAVMPELSKIRIPLGDLKPRFIGWRWDGGRLRRVSHTETRERVLPLLDPDGKEEFADPPMNLIVDGVVPIDNGIHYNLVDPRLPAAEAAERVTRFAAMARGSGGRGENDYFYEQGRKVISACISLHRAVEATQCTAVDIVRLATQDQRLTAALARLSEKVKLLRDEAGKCKSPEAAQEILRRQVAPLEDMGHFFRDEWQRMVADGKTANIIRSTISGAFDVFLQDPHLAETFCQPSTFSFEDVVQSGKIIGLVPGDQYEQLGRLLGTACKIDFQSAMLARNGRPDLNSARLAIYFADECHKYIISGSSTAGDPYFMNLSRSNNVVNICATQSYAWIVEVIGREAANVYISAFGVQFWLQQVDPETSRRAAEICGSVTEEKVTADHNVDFGGLLATLGSGQTMSVRHRVREEERSRFRAEDFSHLNVGEIISYNKGREGRRQKVTKGNAEYIFCTERPNGVAAVNERVREYFREILENLTHERGQSRRWDCLPRGELTVRADLTVSPPGSGPSSSASSPPTNEAPQPPYQSVLPLTPGFTVGSRPLVQVASGDDDKMPLGRVQTNHGGILPPPPKCAGTAEGADEEGGITPADIERDRAAFQEHVGNLDACVGEMSRVEPRGLAVLLEEARRKAERGAAPASKFGEALGHGYGGMVSEDPHSPVRPAADVATGTSDLPYSGDLATQVANVARQSRLKRESAEKAEAMRAAPRPKANPGALDLRTMRELVS